MNRYYITNRTALGGIDPLLACIGRNDAAGVELIQIREKDLSPRGLAALVQRAVQLCRRSKVLVNTRVDVALACGAHGAHLPAGSPAPAAWRHMVPPGFLFGVSCHSLEEVAQAGRDGADFVVFGPVFKPLSKADDRRPCGLEGLKDACSAARVPVYALGGITAENAPLCVNAGAAGVAGITLFQG